MIYNGVLVFSVQHSDPVIHIHVYSFVYSFPFWFIPGRCIEFPVPYRRTLLFLHECGTFTEDKLSSVFWSVLLAFQRATAAARIPS